MKEQSVSALFRVVETHERDKKRLTSTRGVEGLMELKQQVLVDKECNVYRELSQEGGMIAMTKEAKDKKEFVRNWGNCWQTSTITWTNYFPESSEWIMMRRTEKNLCISHMKSTHKNVFA